MKIFRQYEVEEAKAYALAGGQALHLHRIIVDRKAAPGCFVRAVDRGEDIAHLFDQDELRLRATAKQLGVRVVFVEHPGTDRQHIDLCGRPLANAKALAIKMAEISIPTLCECDAGDCLLSVKLTSAAAEARGKLILIVDGCTYGPEPSDVLVARKAGYSLYAGSERE